MILIGGMLALITEAQFEPRTVQVTRVIDRDTIQVTTGGQRYTVRLIGVDTRDWHMSALPPFNRLPSGLSKRAAEWPPEVSGAGPFYLRKPETRVETCAWRAV